MTKLSLSSLVFALAAAAAPTIANAQPAGAGGSAGGPYGAAGCGLGSILFGSSRGFVQIFAATTNSFLGTQTFGITSGTSNCGANVVVVVATKDFIETNREAFAKDVSRGSGETIDTIASMGGCSNSAAVGAHLQRDFKTIFPSAEAKTTEVSAAAVQSLKSDKSLGCSKLI